MKFQLFHSYITSKWMWAAGVVWPSVRALKAVEGYQNPLVEWVQDFRAVRRAAKYLCGQHGGPQWRRDWLCRIWRYWGHVARSTVSTPLSSMVAEGGGIGISMGRVAAAHVVATIPRKLQFCFAQFSSRHRNPAWHIVAQDRLAWATLEVAWLDHWGVRLHLEPSPAELAMRQLVVVGEEMAQLRPHRAFPDDPYRTTVLCIGHYAHRHGVWVIWVKTGEGVMIQAWDTQQDIGEADVLQVRATGEWAGLLWRTWAAVAAMVEQVPLGRRHDLRVVMPPHLLATQFLLEVPGRFHGEMAFFRQVDMSSDLLSKVWLPPKKTPQALKELVHTEFTEIPSPFSRLLRKHNFSRAQFLT